MMMISFPRSSLIYRRMKECVAINASLGNAWAPEKLAHDLRR